MSTSLPRESSGQTDKTQDQFVEVFTPLKIVQPLAWLGLVAVSVGVGGTLLWSVIGSVRESISITGVVAHPGGLVQVFSPATERIDSIEVQPGQVVKKDQVIARLRSESQEERVKTSIKNYQITEDSNQNLIRLAKQRLTEVKHISSRLDKIYQPLSEKAENLYGKRLITADVLAQAKKNYLENRLSLLSESSVLEVLIKDLQEQIINKKGESSIQKSILSEKYVINSPVNGVVQDINYIIGEYPTPNTPLATISKLGDQKLIVLATADSGDADKVTVGDRVLFTPSNVERNRYGGIIGEVKSIQRRPVSSEYIVNFTDNRSIGEKLALNERLYLIHIQLERDNANPTGFKWSSGIGPTSKRKPYTSLLGKATIYYDEKKPITYVLPFIRGLVGLSNNPGGE